MSVLVVFVVVASSFRPNIHTKQHAQSETEKDPVLHGFADGWLVLCGGGGVEVGRAAPPAREPHT